MPFHVNRDDETSSLLPSEPFLEELSLGYGTKEVVSVPSRSIDQLVSQLRRSPDILKIDTQGNDAAVLAGAQWTLRNDPPRIIQTELLFASAYIGQGDWLDTSTMLRNYGYRLHSITGLIATSMGNLYFGDATWLSAEAWIANGLR